MIGFPFTVNCLPHALRSALGALRQGGSLKAGHIDPVILPSFP
jgi:hypothetical protein